MTDPSRRTSEDGARTTAEHGVRTTDDGRSTDASPDGFRRREFVALGAGASATLLAGCAGDGSLPSSGGSDGSDGSDDSDGSETLTGGFRLLISDAPADIGDFDRLDVTLDRARVFESEDGDDEGEDGDGESDDDDERNATDTDDGDGSTNETADDDTAGEDIDEDHSEDEEERGFTVVELDAATVDLTRVIEDDAIAVFDGEIPAGSYEKIELEVSATEGIVDGDEVEVKLPSEKLQITNAFEVTPDEELSFVFDINVVKRGPNNGYILQPVISGSGVAGRDVEVNEIDDEGESEGSEAGDDESGDDGGDEADDAGGATGNETAGGGNETAGGGS